MDYSTGLPQISIPLFEVQSGELRVPISISYHASGCRISDGDGPIARGWSLNTGAAVSRTIHGSTDFGNGCGDNFPFPNPFMTNNINPNDNLDDLAYAEGIMHYFGNPDLVTIADFLDSEYDIFSYTIGNNSGKLVFHDENGTKTPKLIPPKPFTIIPRVGNCHLSGLDFIDDKGILYDFLQAERNSYGSTIGYTGYAINQITSADKTDSINYYYGGGNQRRTTLSQFITLEDKYYPEPPNDGPYANEDLVTNTNFDSYQISRISQITFENGKAIFNLIDGPWGNETHIDNIEISDRDNHIIKTIKFHRSQLHEWPFEQKATHKLDSITVHDKMGKAVEKYAFEHYPTPYVDNSSTDTKLNWRYIDWWGYYNGSGQGDMIPSHTVSVDGGVWSGNYNLLNGNPQAKREPKLNALLSGVLKKITFPTGGSTEFTFEHNKYNSLETGLITNGPGLRVEQIVNKDNLGNTYYRTFKYGDQELGYGFIDLEPILPYMVNQKIHLQFDNGDAFHLNRGHRQRTFYSGFVPELSEVAARPVQYLKVTEYKGTIGENTGKTIYEYDRIPWGARGLGPSLWDIPKYNYWDTAVLKKQVDYEKMGVNTYEERREIMNNYTSILLEEIKGLHIQRRISATGDRVNYDTGGGIYSYPESHIVNGGLVEGNWGPLSIYLNGEYNIPVGTKHMISSIETLFNADGTTTSNSTSYTYNSKQLVSQIKRESSDETTERTLETQIKYPFDYTGIGVLTQMVSPSINMVNFPVEEIQLREGQELQTVKTDYYDWGSGSPMIKAKLVAIKKENNTLEPRIQFTSYDNDGNTQTVSKIEGADISYIWGYGQEYPVAKIENADENQIASFVANIRAKSNLDNDRTNDVIAPNGNVTYVGKEGELRQALQNLRTSLPNAMVTTFTYDPLIGVTSMTDPKGYIMYYEYDDFNRLKAIRDAKGNLISDSTYKYAGETN